MKMKREIFSRGVRMIHTFEGLIDRQDPLATQTFEAPWPKRVDALSEKAAGHPCTSQEYGLHNYRPDSSPVCKPGGGYAHSDGPLPDYAMDLAMPLPVGTKRRLGPPKTDK
jgi:hypothetical protein